jgi:hypothetical protein
MRKITNLLLILCGLFFILSCEDDSESKDCIDNEYYLSFTVNGVNYCYTNCSGNLFEISYGDTTKYQTSVGAGEVFSDENDTIWLFPSFAMQFPDKIARTYNNDDISGLSYFAQFDYEEGSFFFPSLFHEHENEYFELTVTEYDLDKKKVAGTFHGILFNSQNNTDSIVIEDGRFISQTFQLTK